MYLAASSLIVEQPRNYLANTIINLKIIKIILHKKEKQKKKKKKKQHYKENIDIFQLESRKK